MLFVCAQFCAAHASVGGGESTRIRGRCSAAQASPLASTAAAPPASRQRQQWAPADEALSEEASALWLSSKRRAGSGCRAYDCLQAP